MPRSRNIKPGFFANDLLAECEHGARLVFVGLWTLADREGRLEDRPVRIKGQLLPYDNCDVESWLQQLADRGFINRYKVAGAKYIQVVNFEKHQSPHIKEGASTIPAPDSHQTSTGVAALIPDSGYLNPDSCFLIPDSGTLNPDSGSLNGSASAEPCRAQTSDIDAVVAHYKKLHPKARPGKEDRKRIAARLKEGYTADDLKAAIDGNHRSPYHCGENDGGTEYHRLDLIMRDSSKVTGFIEMPEAGAPVLSERTRRTLRAGENLVNDSQIWGTDDVPE